MAKIWIQRPDRQHAHACGLLKTEVFFIPPALSLFPTTFKTFRAFFVTDRTLNKKKSEKMNVYHLKDSALAISREKIEPGGP